MLYKTPMNIGGFNLWMDSCYMMLTHYVEYRKFVLLYLIYRIPWLAFLLYELQTI